MSPVQNQPIPFGRMRKVLQYALPSAFLVGVLASPAAALTLTPIGTYASGIFDASAAEIPTYDAVTQRLFISNDAAKTIDVLSISDPTNPSLLFSLDITSYGGGINSVAFSNGILAAAVEAVVKQDPGSVVFFNADGEFLNSVTVGALPDMLTFTPDNTKVLVGNEGEPNDDYTIDPEGSVSIIDISNGIENASVTTAGFTAFNNRKDELIAAGVRIFGPNATVAQDLEPEYITASEDSTKAWIALQENNAIAILDILSGEITDIYPLGFKDHSLPGNELDGSDRDGAINIRNWPILGMYQPDAITSYTVNGKTYIVTANEGDARDYDGFSEESRLGNLTLDPDVFPNAEELQANENLGRLTVTTATGDTNGDGIFKEIYAFGARSFSIWDGDSLELIYDSGSDFERLIADRFPDFFNSNHREISFDTRSDDKGPEPEGVVLGEIMGRTYAFVGFERFGGVITYDITDPSRPFFVDYVNNRDFFGNPEAGTAGDLGPEGLIFISADQSPNQKPLVVVTNEVSGTTTLFQVNIPEETPASVPEPASALAFLVLAPLGYETLKRKGKREA